MASLKQHDPADRNDRSTTTVNPNLFLQPDDDVIERSTVLDIRAAGWAVAVHNDYRIGEKNYTFWLFTKDDRCVKGDGRSDAEALDAVRSKLKVQP